MIKCNKSIVKICCKMFPISNNNLQPLINCFICYDNSGHPFRSLDGQKPNSMILHLVQPLALASFHEFKTLVFLFRIFPALNEKSDLLIHYVIFNFQILCRINQDQLVSQFFMFQIVNQKRGEEILSNCYSSYCNCLAENS